MRTPAVTREMNQVRTLEALLGSCRNERKGNRMTTRKA